MFQNLKNLLWEILKKKGISPIILLDSDRAFGVQFVAKDVPFSIHIIPTNLDKLPYAIVLNSPAVVDIPLEPSVLLAILQMNLQIPIGAFGYANGVLMYKHSITDNDLTDEELERILDIAINIVNEYAKRIIATFGGHLALEFPPGFELKA